MRFRVCAYEVLRIMTAYITSFGIFVDLLCDGIGTIWRFDGVWRYVVTKYVFRAFEQSYYEQKSLCLVVFHVEQSFHI